MVGPYCDDLIGLVQVAHIATYLFICLECSHGCTASTATWLTSDARMAYYVDLWLVSMDWLNQLGLDTSNLTNHTTVLRTREKNTNLAFCGNNILARYVANLNGGVEISEFQFSISRFEQI